MRFICFYMKIPFIFCNKVKILLDQSFKVLYNRNESDKSLKELLKQNIFKGE